VAAGGGLEAVGGVGVGLETGDGWGSEWAWLKRLNACTIARTRVQRTWKEKKNTNNQSNTRTIIRTCI